MKYLVLALAFLATATAARAQDAVPDLKGTWTGKGKVLIYGNTTHHPTTATPDQPRVRDIEMTLTIEGQDGRLVWGRSSSAAADTKEPLAWAIAADNKTVVGADTDGYFQINLTSPDRMERCYLQNALSRTKAIVVGCYALERVKK